MKAMFTAILAIIQPIKLTRYNTGDLIWVQYKIIGPDKVLRIITYDGLYWDESSGIIRLY